MKLDDAVGLLPSWFADAACLDHPNPEWWFPEGQGASTRDAQAVCAGCPTREACGAYADAEGFTFGVFAGRNYASPRARITWVAGVAPIGAYVSARWVEQTLRRLSDE